MNKAELVAKAAEGADINKVDAEGALNAAIETIIKTLAKGDKVQLIGFGIFSSGNCAARIGRNPKTGKEVKIPAVRTVKFTTGKEFKDRVNKRK